MDTVQTRVTRAAVWTGRGVDVKNVDLPELASGETLVRVRLATVCGSDLHTVTRRRRAPCPSVLGHEAVGTVVAGGTRSITVGDRVVWSVTVSCGRCARCRSGFTAKCSSVRKVGHERFDGDWPLSGAYAEHVVLPPGTSIAKVPESMPDAVAAPAACATATVMATLEAAGSVTGRRVLVIGGGMLGLTAAAALAEAGARVRVTDVDAQRLEMVSRFGGTPDGGGSVDAAIDFSGSSDAIDSAFARLSTGGVLVLAGSVLPGRRIEVSPETMVRQWLTITGVHNYEPRHLTRAVKFLERTLEVYPWRAVVADPVDLDAIASALAPAPAGKLRAAVAP
ncbi:zinc-binding dehydrogenase [Mycolicibacterium gadium]|uniref:alcohol dehydrogenase n=1 Tax=Mycolicibacterium gadium TaxID=1794 RepID=A0A7I7WU99_MYCGU|nr:zinc-binding dehydrogenase [Mycolicibacterium gadium]BBZ20650.1 alcohol dehydrogenase [Mycolicibacterium gadium]